MTTLTGPAKASQKQGKTKTDTSRTGNVAKVQRRRMAFAVPTGRIKTGLPVAVWAIVIRATTLVLDYLLVMVSAVGIIPMIGLYLHQASGAAQADLTTSGTVALWIVPLLFVVTLLTVAEFVLMRWLWRAGGRRIVSIREHHAAQ